MLDGRVYARAKKIDATDECVYAIYETYTWGLRMRTNIVIDDNLMSEALVISGYKTKKETVEEGLKLLIAMRSQASVKRFRGKMHWEGDLSSMRIDE